MDLNMKFKIYILTCMFISGYSFSYDDLPEQDFLDLTLEELMSIKVTAQKRVENLNETPISIRFINRLQINNANITRIEELSHIASSLVYDKSIDFTKSSFKIRGIGTEVFGAGVEPSVATMVDGVVMARGGAGFDDIVDIEQIEILYGSQSTLFGKNASAGLININTAKPNKDSQEQFLGIRFTDDNEALAVYRSTGPVNQELAYRFTGQIRNYDGNVGNLFNEHRLNGYDTYNAKGKLLWHFEEDQEWLLIVDYSQQNTSTGVRVLREDSASIFTDPGAIGLDGVPATAGTITGIDGSNINDKVNLDRDPFANVTAWGVSLNTTMKLGSFKLSNIIAYRNWQQENDRDNDQTQLPFSLMQLENRDVSWFSEELHLSSPVNDNYDYIIGLYYYQSENLDNSGDARTLSNEPYLFDFNLANNTIENTNAAVFGQLNFHINKRIKALFGGRYLYDKVGAQLSRSAYTQNNSYLSDGETISTRNIDKVTNQHSTTAFIGKAGLQWDWQPSIMFYTTYSRGFKGEGFNTSFKFNVDSFLNDEPVQPESSDTFELGLRSDWLQGTLRLNTTLFYTKYHHLQLTVRDLENNRNVLGSVPGVLTKGLEIDFLAMLPSDTTIEGSLTYLDASYSDFTNANCYSGQTVTQGCISTPQGKIQNLTGHSLANAPKWKSTIGLHHSFMISNYQFSIESNWRVQSNVNLDSAGNIEGEHSGYGIFDAGLNLNYNKTIKIKLFVNNLFDKQYISGITINGNAGGDLLMQLLPRDFNRFIGVNMNMIF